MSQLSNIKASSCRTAFQAPPALFTALNAIATDVYARPRDHVFREGMPCSGVFLLRSGSVRATTQHKDGRDIVNRILGPGAVLGLPSAMCSRAFQFSAEAIEPCEIGFVETSVLNEFLRGSPILCMEVVGMMSDELIELRETRDHMKKCTDTSCSLHGACKCSQ